jgi:hypothetical protein
MNEEEFQILLSTQIYRQNLTKPHVLVSSKQHVLLSSIDPFEF